MKLWIGLFMFWSALALPCAAQNSSSSPSTPGAEATTSQTELDSLLHAAQPPIALAADDVISVQVFRAKDYDFQQRVARDGTVLFPLLGVVHVSGLTTEELQEKVASLLQEKGFFQDPQVIIDAVSQPSAVVTVSGSVNKPGVFPAFGNLTVSDYINEAGGLIEYVPVTAIGSSPASPVVTLIRPSLKEPVAIPLGPDPKASPYGRIPVFAGDEIRVGKVGVVYAVGAFKSQGIFPLKNSSPTTVLQVVAMAGGIGFEADKSDAQIIRTRDGARFLVHVNVSKILSGKMADVALQSEDILFVPTNQMKAAIKGGGTGLIVSLASAYVYAVH